MKQLLDSQFVPNLLLLEHFYKQTSQETITYFSEALGMDRRLILKTVHSIKKDIDNNGWQDMITINLIEKNLVARIGPLFSLQHFYAYYMSRSLCVDFVLHLFNNQTDPIEKLTDRFYVSKATLYRRLAPLKLVLADFDLTLDFTNGKKQLIGSEKQIRYFYFTLFWEVFRSFPYSKNLLIDFENDFFQSFYNNHTLPIQLITVFELHFEIALHRIEQGYMMENFPTYELPEIYFSFSSFQDVAYSYFSPYSISESQIENELLALYFSIVTSTLYSKKECLNISLNNIPWSSYRIPIIQKSISYFTTFFELELSNEEYLYLLVNVYYLQLKRSVFNGGTLHFEFNSVDEVLAEDNQYVLNQANRFFLFLDTKKPQFHVSKFYKLYYTLLLRRIIFNASPSLQVLICSKVGLEEQRWLEKRISDISTVPIQFHDTWTPDTAFDLIISDFQLHQKYIPKDPDNYLLLLAFPDSSEWVKIIVRLEKIYFNKK